MKKIRLLPSEKEVSVEDGQTVLSALEKAGYALPNNCRAGACGECKAKVCSGEIDQGFVLDMALPQSERAEGYGLMCMAKLKSDVIEIEYGTEDALPKLFPPKENLRYVVTEKTQVTPTITRFRLRSLGENMRFWPGQYVTIGDKIKGIPERCYSIANIPNQESELLLYITRVEDGKTSKWLHDEVMPGEMIKVNGPYGTFIGDPSAETPVLCLAAGSGLAPIQSLATAAMLRGGFKYPATVLFSAKTKEDLVEFGHFSYLKTKFRNFDYKYTLTREESEGSLKGRIPEVLPSLYPDLSKHSIYIAGSEGFVEDCKKKVLELGAQEELIHVEGFVSQNV
jgi:CDP-4-dehydro-6-deoxyglucose reductase